MKKYILSCFVLFLSFVFIPSDVSAANIYFETTKNNVSVGDTFIVSVKIDAEKTKINSVEGDIILENNKENLIVNDFSLAKSIFSLWPRTPSLSKDGNTISFVGGVPGGFDLDKAILFNIVLQANKEGEIKITPQNLAVFSNDGKGTRVPLTVGNLDIKVLSKNEAIASSNEWSSLVNGDKINPEKFDIVVGREPTLFEGKRFAFFTAVDNQSGISYYEVSENDSPAIRSGSMYVLSNQDDKVTPILKVTAFDKAGNETSTVYKNPGIMIFGFSINFFIIIILIIIIWIIYKKIIKLKKVKDSKNNVL